MKITTRMGRCLALLTLACALIPDRSGAQPSFTGHYPNGAEGIKAGSLPPPGFYLRDYNLFYSADRFPGGPDDFELFAYVNAVRAIWISEIEIFGGNYGADVLVPFGYTDLEIQGFTRDAFSLGDIHVEPITLSWREQRWDLAVGYAIWVPTGNYEIEHPERLTKGFWSHMITVGGTWYADANRTWALSVLNRYEIHTQHEEFHITPGNTYTLEWGVSKTVAEGLDVGVVGYWQQQTTEDSVTFANRPKDRVLAVGPEASGMIPRIGVIASLRYLREFAAADRPEGQLISLTLTRPF